MDESGEKDPSKEKLKPAVLYHASPNKNLDVLEPRAESVRHKDEGSVVFATTDNQDGITKFLVKNGGIMSRINGVHIHVIKNGEEYIKNDKGGAVYEVPSDTFTLETKFGGGRNEWTSKNNR